MKKNSKLYNFTKKYYLYFLLYFFAALYGLGFMYTSLWALCTFYVVFLSWLWVEKPLFYHRLLHSFLSGFIIMLITTTWMIQIDHGTWAGSAQLKIQPFINVTWVASSLIWGLGFLIAPLLFKASSKNVRHIPSLYILFIGSFAVAEWCRSVLFSLFNYGSGSSTGPYWSFGAYGLAITNSVAVYASRIVGLFGLSFIAAMFGIGIFLILRKKYRKAGLVMMIPLVACSAIGYALPATNQQLPFSTTIVHEPLGPSIFTERVIQDKSTQSTWKLSEQKQVVLFPEYSGVFDQEITTREKTLLSTIENNQDSVFMDAEAYYEKGQHYNRIALHKKDGEVIDGLKKSFLIPAGEYIPSYTSFLLQTFGGSTILNNLSDRIITKGDEPIRPFEVYGEKIGVLACSGAIAPELYRSLAKQDASLLINSASLGIFKNAPAYYKQNFAFARFQAVANARPFIQIARQGPSFVLDKDGMLLDYYQPRTETAVASYTLQKNTKKTPYTTYGEWVVYCLMLVIGIRGVIHIHRRRTAKK